MRTSGSTTLPSSPKPQELKAILVPKEVIEKYHGTLGFRPAKNKSSTIVFREPEQNRTSVSERE